MSASGAERYFALVEATLREGLARPSDALARSAEETFPLDAALIAVAVRFQFGGLQSPAHSLDRAAQRLSTAARFVDGAGHSRPTYASLAIRAIAMAGRASGTYALDCFSELNANRVQQLASRSEPSGFDAAEGSHIVGEVFAAWATLVSRGMAVPDMFSATPSTGGTPVPRDVLARDALRNVSTAQQPDSTFLARTSSDSLEPQWYDELAILHALSCYASESGDAEIAAAVRRAVKYHAAETQPDHASTHPWAIAAFLDDPDAIPLADMMLHAAGVQEPRTMDAVSLLLLADALDCGRRRRTR